MNEIVFFKLSWLVFLSFDYIVAENYVIFMFLSANFAGKNIFFCDMILTQLCCKILYNKIKTQVRRQAHEKDSHC